MTKTERIAELVKKANSRLIKSYDEIEDPNEVSFNIINDFIIIKYKEKSGIIERISDIHRIWVGHLDLTPSNSTNFDWVVKLELLNTEDRGELRSLLQS